MGLRWHLADLVVERALSTAELALRLGGPVSPHWLAAEAPPDLTMADLAMLCEALSCQPGDLLSYEPESPQAQAERNLAGDLFYQSWLAHRAQQEEQD